MPFQNVPSQNRSLGLIGYGNWGKNLARNFASLGMLHSICDVDKEKLALCSSLYPDVKIEKDYDALLSDPVLSQIAIATPLTSHYDLAKKALLARKDVFIEKPLCLNVGEAKELIEIAEKNHLILMVGHILHYHPVVIELKERVEKGEAGTLKTIIAERYNPSNDSQEKLLWDLAPHDISLTLSFFNSAIPQSVACSHAAFNENGELNEVFFSLSFKQIATKAQIHISRLASQKKQLFTLIGSKATFIFDDTKPWNEKLIKIEHLHPNIKKALIVPEIEPLKNECLHFLHCCKERITPQTSGKEAEKTIALLQDVQSKATDFFLLKKIPKEENFYTELTSPNLTYSLAPDEQVRSNCAISEALSC